MASQEKSVNLVEMASNDDMYTLTIPNSQVVLKEWNPEDAAVAALSVQAPDNGLRPRVASEQAKEHIQFEYVFAIGGDGTLLRLLRILFFRFLPSSIPKIITVSMGSLGYLCNFKIKEMMGILSSTVLQAEVAVHR